MVKDKKIFGLPVPQAISLATFIAGVISVWIHLEIQIAAINVEIINLKKNMSSTVPTIGKNWMPSKSTSNPTPGKFCKKSMRYKSI